MDNDSRMVADSAILEELRHSREGEHKLVRRLYEFRDGQWFVTDTAEVRMPYKVIYGVHGPGCAAGHGRKLVRGPFRTREDAQAALDKITERSAADGPRWRSGYIQEDDSQ